jgi:hypothetical protein
MQKIRNSWNDCRTTLSFPQAFLYDFPYYFGRMLGVSLRKIRRRILDVGAS